MALNDTSKFQSLLTKAGKLKSDADAATELLTKAAEVADAETDKAVKSAGKSFIDTVKNLAKEQADAAKDAGNKELAKALAQLGKDIVEAVKAA